MKTITRQRSVALGTLAILAATTFAGAAFTPVQAASKKTWRDIAIGAGAVTGYGLLKKNRTVAIVGGVGTAYAYTRYRKASKQQKRRSINWYQRRYGRSWRAHYPG